MVELAHSLALVAARLNDDARAALLDLIEGPLRDQVADLGRRVDPEDLGLADYQLQLLAGFTPPKAGEQDGGGQSDEGAEVATGEPGLVGRAEGDDADVATREGAAVGDGEGGPEAAGDDSQAAAGAGDVEEGSGTAGDGPQPGDSAGLVAILAMLCATGPKARAADLLLHLPLHLQGQVIPKLLKTSILSAPAGLLPPHRALVEALREAATSREAWGVEPVCEILRAIDSTRQLRRLLTVANEVDHEAVVVLQNHLFAFEDLLRLSDRDLQALLVQIDNHTFGQALLLTDKKVHAGMLRNISARRRGLIAEEEARWADSNLREIETAQQRMLAMARHLYEQGKITTYFGSVSRTGLAEGEVVDEPDEPEVANGEEEEEVEESGRNYRGLLAGIAAVVATVVVIWGVVAWVALDKEPGRRPTSSGAGGGSSAGGSVGMVASDGIDMTEAADGSATASPEGEQILPVQAVVEMPGQARVEATGQTEVVAVDEEEAVFEMRVGKVRTTVFDEDFEMRTPVVKIKGSIRGTLFETRVVLDATTTVAVLRGSVEVESLVQTGRRWLLQKDMRGLFDTAGNGQVEKIARNGS